MAHLLLADGRAVVTFTHTGGDPLHAERVYVGGEGFAAVAGVDHQEPGPWRGTLSGERPRRGGPAIVSGDVVTVGITDDCSIVLSYEGEGRRTAVDFHHCGNP